MRPIQSYPGVWLLEPADRHAFFSKLEVTAESIKAGDSIIHPFTLKPVKVRSVDPLPGSESIQITFETSSPVKLRSTSIVAMVQTQPSMR